MCPAFFHLICRLVCFFLILVRSSWVFFTILWAFPEPSWYFHALYRWLLYCFHHSLQWWDYSLCCNKRKIKTGTFSHAAMHCEWDEKAAHQINMRERIQCHPNVLKFVQVNWARCFYIDMYIFCPFALFKIHTRTQARIHTNTHVQIVFTNKIQVNRPFCNWVATKTFKKPKQLRLLLRIHCVYVRVELFRFGFL